MDLGVTLMSSQDHIFRHFSCKIVRRYLPSLRMWFKATSLSMRMQIAQIYRKHFRVKMIRDYYFSSVSQLNSRL